MLGTRPMFRWLRCGQVAIPLLSLVLLGIFLTVANSGPVAAHSVHGRSAVVAVVEFGGATNLPDAHDHAAQQACNSLGSCSMVALTATGASAPKILGADAQEYGAPSVSIARAVRPDIRPPIA